MSTTAQGRKAHYRTIILTVGTRALLEGLIAPLGTSTLSAAVHQIIHRFTIVKRMATVGVEGRGVITLFPKHAPSAKLKARKFSPEDLVQDNIHVGLTTSVVGQLRSLNTWFLPGEDSGSATLRLLIDFVDQMATCVREEGRVALVFPPDSLEDPITPLFNLL